MTRTTEPTPAELPEAVRLQAFAIISQASSDGILFADTKHMITQANPAAAAMLGMTVEHIIGKQAKHCFSQNPALLNLFTRKGDQILDVHLPRRRLAAGIATTLSGGERLVLLQDVTEKRELEARRDALVKRVAHDLRNPISALEGFAELVTKFGDLNLQQQKFVTRIRQTATKLYDVVESLVDLAWIEAGMPLAHVPIQLGALIKQTVSQLSSLALQHKMVIAVSVQDPIPVIMGDPQRIQMVIYHLLQNAILYSPPEQTVAIHAWADDREAYCSVADRGIGIADDELELIFDRLYRSRDEQVRDTPGGGLGLTIARTIIQRHGGDLWASSNPGQGSTFTFVLPTIRY
jgi:signal transduction histidine kinase